MTFLSISPARVARLSGLLGLVLGLGLTLPAAAAPGWSATGLTVSPVDAPRVIAAMDALFDARVTQSAPIRVVLRANVADGTNPETHTVVVMFDSAARREEFDERVYADAAWATFMQTMSGLNQAPGTTMRGVVLYSSGEFSDSDAVWVNHYVTVDEPAVLLSAMRTYSQSAAGKAAPGQVASVAIAVI